MGTDNQRFKDPATARKYIKSLAICFEDPRELSEFLGMCDIVQAAFVNLLVKDISYERVKQADYLLHDDCKHEMQVKIMNASNNYKQAAAELEQVKQKLKLIISRLSIVSI